ncbi:MAG: iron-containing redox enzyme family protein [Azospirillaceae bacterium]|nr:iron-containing redox enzyme family protein [Azospirillaceae bacterium]
MKPAISAVYRTTPLAGSKIGDISRNFINHPLFAQPTSFLCEDNPFRRPLRPQDLPTIDLTRPLPQSEFASNAALLGQRLLATIYETDLLFLPTRMDSRRREDMRAFYDDDFRQSGELLRPTLERQLFGFLEDEITVSGNWTLESFRAYAADAVAQANRGASEVVRTIRQARDPGAAATEFLVQLASDFLSEASAMARNVLGNYGPAQSGLFTILIDEYGYGVPKQKHSTIFEATLASRGLDNRPHAYWQFYLPSSLALVNYFHFVSKNHNHFGRYVGALLYTEATLAEANRQQSDMLRTIFGTDVDTLYFDEHVQIDPHHGKMALERVIVPLVARCGNGLLGDIVRGFEEFRLLQQLADQDLIDQIKFADRLFKAPDSGALCTTQPGLWDGPGVLRFDEPKGEISVPHLHDVDEIFELTEGEIEFTVGPAHAITLKAGEAVLIPARRLHGTKVLSERCRYRVAEAVGYGLVA